MYNVHITLIILYILQYHAIFTIKYKRQVKTKLGIGIHIILILLNKKLYV